jgi:hypothetical protein
VALVESIVIPADGTVLRLLEGHEDNVRAVALEAGLTFERILGSRRIEGSKARERSTNETSMRQEPTPPIALAITLMAMALTTAATTASAAPPAPVTIQATVTQAGFSGVWQGSGAITDSGTFRRTDVNLTGSFFNSPAAGAFQAEFEFSGSQGTFSLRDELVADDRGVNGNWQMVSGTGAYDGISGHGTSSFDFSTSTVNFTGVISKDALP